MIDRKDFKNSVEWVKKNHDGCSHIRVAETKQGDLCLVFGWGVIEEYNEGIYHVEKQGVLMKLAVNVDDLQCDFDYDWEMPFDEKGNVWDTMTTAEETTLDWIEKEAVEIVKALNEGKVKVK